MDIRRYETAIASCFYAEYEAQEDDVNTYNELYRSMIGSLTFLANRKRPDIATAVEILEKYV